MKMMTFLAVIALVGCTTRLEAQTSQWNKIASLPEGGAIRDLATANDGTLYALGTWTSDIFYSTNDGQNWQQVLGTQPFWNVLDIEVDKVSKTLYVGTSHEGICWTSNFGITWQQEYIYTNSTSAMHATFESMAVKNGTGIVVGHEPTIAPPSFFYTTTNSGTTWTTYQAPFRYVSDLHFLPNGDLLAATEQGVQLSVNNGATWTALNTGIANMYIKALAHKPSNGVLLAGAIFNMSTQDTTGTGVYVSANNGASWTASNAGLTNKKITCLMVDTTSGFVYATTEGGVFVSNNNGLNWTAVNTNLASTRLSTITQNASGIFMGSDRSGVAFSPTPVSNWTYRNTGIYINFMQDMLLDNSNALYLLDGDATGVHKRAGANAPWQMVSTGLPPYPGRSIVKDHSGNLYVTFSTINGQPKQGVFKSSNGGSSWTDISSTMPFNTSLPWVSFGDIEAGPNNELYVYVSGEIFRSLNGGTSWTKIRQLTDAFVDMDVAPVSGNLYIQTLPATLTPTIEVSTNQGTSFSPVSTGSLFLAECTDLLIDRNDSIYLNSSYTLYKRNGSNNWVQLPNGGWDKSLFYACDMNVYFDNQNAMFVSAREDGMFHSPDGITWSPLNTGIPVYNNSAWGPTRLTLIDLQFDSSNTPYARSYDEEGGHVLGIYSFSVPNSIKEPDKEFPKLTIHPNPVTHTANLSFYSVTGASALLTLYDVSGKKVKTLAVTVVKGANSLSIDMSQLAPGLYSFVLTDGHHRFTGMGVRH